MFSNHTIRLIDHEKDQLEKILTPQHCFNRNSETLTWRSSKIFISFLHSKTFSTFDQHNMAVATKIQLPYLEDTVLDGKKLYTPKKWNEQFRHYIKRIHNIDIKQILTYDTAPIDENGNTKNQKSDKN